MTIGSDGKLRVREFDNVRCPFGGEGTTTVARPLISSEREPLQTLEI